jgi:hypothetical protein
MKKQHRSGNFLTKRQVERTVVPALHRAARLAAENAGTAGEHEALQRCLYNELNRTTGRSGGVGGFCVFDCSGTILVP